MALYDQSGKFLGIQPQQTGGLYDASGKFMGNQAIQTPQQTGGLLSMLQTPPPGSETLGQAGIGFGKEILNRLSTLGSVAPTIGNAFSNSILNLIKPGTGTQKPFNPIPNQTLDNTAQKVGGGAENLAEYFIPLGETSAATNLTKLLPHLPSFLATAGIQGLSMAGRTALQGGSQGDINTAGILGAGFPIAGKIASETTKPIVNLLSNFSGYAPDVVKKALERGQGVQQGLKGGEQTLVDTVQTGAKNLGKFAGDTSSMFKKELDKIAEKYPYQFNASGVGVPTVKNQLTPEVGDFVKTGMQKLREFDLTSSKGIVQFGNKPAMATEEKKAIQGAFNALKSIQTDATVKNVERQLENIRAFQKFETKAGTHQSAVVQNIFNSAENVANKIYQELGALRQKYAVARGIIENGKSLFGKSFNPDAKETATAVKKMYQLYNTGNLPIRNAQEVVGTKIGKDITGQAAGAIMKAGDQYSQRATQITTRKLPEKILEALPRSALNQYVKTGKLTPEIMRSQKTQRAIQIAIIDFAKLLRGGK